MKTCLPVSRVKIQKSKLRTEASIYRNFVPVPKKHETWQYMSLTDSFPL